MDNRDTKVLPMLENEDTYMASFSYDKRVRKNLRKFNKTYQTKFFRLLLIVVFLTPILLGISIVGLRSINSWGIDTSTQNGNGLRASPMSFATTAGSL